MRLGHAHSLKMIDSFKNYIPDLDIKVQISHCDICLMARQRRLPFPLSTTNNKSIFEPIYADIWGT